MQADLLPFIDWSHHPRQIIASQERIITADDPTDMLFLLEKGVALAPNAALLNQPQHTDKTKIVGNNDVTYRAGALLSLLEMLSLNVYRHDVIAHEECHVIGINRFEIKTMWDRDSHLAWPLSCSVAATITQRRQTRFLI
tara:strand:- start:402 stop:821 length:420 start_codon:yes stop_codon:yes gene_type:complete